MLCFVLALVNRSPLTALGRDLFSQINCCVIIDYAIALVAANGCVDFTWSNILFFFSGPDKTKHQTPGPSEYFTQMHAKITSDGFASGHPRKAGRRAVGDIPLGGSRCEDGTKT